MSADTEYPLCLVPGPKVEHDVPNGWRSWPACKKPKYHGGRHRYESALGYAIEWDEPCPPGWGLDALRSGTPQEMRRDG